MAQSINKSCDVCEKEITGEHLVLFVDKGASRKSFDVHEECASKTFQPAFLKKVLPSAEESKSP